MNWQNFFQCHQSGACVVCLVASWEELGVEVIKQQILIKSEIYKEEKLCLILFQAVLFPLVKL